MSNLFDSGETTTVTDPNAAAQAKADQSQTEANTLLSRRRRKTVLSTGASSTDTSSTGQATAFKTLLGG